MNTGLDLCHRPWHYFFAHFCRQMGVKDKINIDDKLHGLAKSHGRRQATILSVRRVYFEDNGTIGKSGREFGIFMRVSHFSFAMLSILLAKKFPLAIPRVIVCLGYWGFLLTKNPHAGDKTAVRRLIF